MKSRELLVWWSTTCFVAFALYLLIGVIFCDALVDGSYRLENSNFSASEYDALYDLYVATNGPSWDCCLEGTVAWNFTSANNNPCVDKWQGIVCLGNYTVERLELFHRKLVGTIPQSMGNLTNLEIIDFGSNSVSGPFPTTICALPNLHSFFFSGNCLTGTIPSAVGNMSNNLEEFWIVGNLFTGTIPESVGNLTNLISLELEKNFLTGTIPTVLGELTHLVTFYLDDNYLTGSLPASLGNLVKLKFFYSDINSLTGTIPASFENLTMLQYIELSYNDFTSSIPLYFSQLSSLVQLIAAYNHFSGNLENLFNASGLPSLEVIQLNNNQFSGTIPTEVFELKGLTTFVVSSNCFVGSLPSTVCNNENMTHLLLDGLSSASACRNYIFPRSWTSTYITLRFVEGTIPTCLFKLPLIAVLHLSGNGFTGPFPSNASDWPNTLVDLSYSHNFLTGTISENVLNHHWLDFDVSFNFLSGTLPSQYQENNYTHLSVDNNRVSGIIPENIIDMEYISILGSNLFDCNYDESNLPVNDDDRNLYMCASNLFDVTAMAWGSFFVVGCIILMGVWQCNSWDTFVKKHAWALDVLKWLDVTRTELSTLCSIFDTITVLTVGCTAYIVIILFPSYAILSSYYGMYTYQYAYFASAAFIAGIIPFGCEMCLWLLLLLLVVIFLYTVNCNRESRENNLSLALGYDKISWGKKLAIYVMYLLANIVAVGGVNSVYVYLAIYTNHTTTQLLSAQGLLSLFKLSWTAKVSPLVLCWICSALNVELFPVRFINLQVVMAILNNIFIPVVVVAVMNEDCFYNTFVDAPVVESTFSTDRCFVTTIFEDTGECMLLLPIPRNMDYLPPFRYGYLCSSSLITYYAPTFMILCIFTSCIVPLLKIVALRALAFAPKESQTFKFFSAMLPPLLKPSREMRNSEGIDEAFTTDFPSLFPCRNMFSLIASYIALLFTFGVVFPLLAIPFALSLVITVYMHKVELGKFIQCAADQHHLEYRHKLESECAMVGSLSLLHPIIWIVIASSCIFYSFFLFDTLGAAVGYIHSYWVLIAVPLLPLVAYYFCCTVVDKALIVPKQKHWVDNNNSNGVRPSDVELTKNSIISVTENRLHYGADHHVK